MAEITTTANNVQVQNQFDSDMTVALIARPQKDTRVILFDTDVPAQFATIGHWGEFWPNESWS